MGETMSTQQYLLRLEEGLIARLGALARQYGKSSGNRVAAEVIETYLDFWESAEQRRAAAVAQQRGALEAGADLPFVGQPAVSQPYLSDPQRRAQRADARGRKDLRDVITDAKKRAREKGKK
jgi:predicted DNA-binding protein